VAEGWLLDVGRVVVRSLFGGYWMLVGWLLGSYWVIVE